MSQENRHDAKIAEAQIVFTKQDTDSSFLTHSDSLGMYNISLPLGVYHVEASHPTHETFNTCDGFYYAQTEESNRADIYLWQKGECSCPESGLLHGNKNYNPNDFSDRAPDVQLSLSQPNVGVGDTVQITISGSDDTGLVHVFWKLIGTCNSNIEGGTIFCQGDTVAEQTWNLVLYEPGNFLITANARDIAFPVSMEAHEASSAFGKACVNLIVE